MEVGIGLPNAVAGAPGPALVEWARRAEEAGFSSLGTIDRVAYPNHESLVALAAAAAATERIRLTTSIVLAPTRPTALLAKQASTVNAISRGRLVLGLAPGGRKDDYDVLGVDFHRRGAAFDAQLEELDRLWSGEERGDGYPVVPEGDRPTLMLGGESDKAYARAARWGAGWIQGGAGPDAFRESMPKLEQAWADAGRDGRPRKLALAYFSLGDDAEEQAQRSLGHYYAWLGPYAEQIANSAAKTPEAVKEYVSAYEGLGCDEFLLFPASDDPEQVELLRDAL